MHQVGKKKKKAMNEVYFSAIKTDKPLIQQQG